jgi:hypothetical protein
MQPAGERLLVNPVSVQKTFVKLGEASVRVLDVSYIRAVVEAGGPFSDLPEGHVEVVTFELDRAKFSLEVTVRGRGEDWVRLDFPKLVPSVRAHLRSFLSPRKIGESILEDWRSGNLRHFHGLNESELWMDDADAVLFTYLDQDDPESQFLIRVREPRGPLAVGKIRRRDYMELTGIEGELALQPLSDSEVYRKLGECRDVVTNFRPSIPADYALKQRMLKIISETLYSTSRRVEMLPPRPNAAQAPVRAES